MEATTNLTGLVWFVQQRIIIISQNFGPVYAVYSPSSESDGAFPRSHQGHHPGTRTWSNFHNHDGYSSGRARTGGWPLR